MRKNWNLKAGRRTALALAAVFVLLGGGMRANAARLQSVVPVGRAAGIKLSAQGVLVVRLSEVQTDQGVKTPARDAGLREGDLILSANGETVSSNESLQHAVSKAENGAVQLEITRDGHSQTLAATPVLDSMGAYKLGVIVRDSMAGIGTITFVDPETGAFGSLGHGICDADTGVLLPLGSGSVMEASVVDAKRGVSGEPGELHGEFNLQQDMGTVSENSLVGVYGTLTDQRYYASGQAVPVAPASEIQTGDAQILSNVSGEEARLYDVKISKLYGEDDDQGRCMLLEVTDPDLIAQTGGIVQGMSGSPVLQNGKIVGAVTHVLVSDPTRGYAIYIEKMLDEMEKSD